MEPYLDDSGVVSPAEEGDAGFVGRVRRYILYVKTTLNFSANKLLLSLLRRRCIRVKFQAATWSILAYFLISLDFTMSVDEKRLAELLALLLQWLVKEAASRKEVQSLIGLLSFVAKCVRAENSVTCG